MANIQYYDVIQRPVITEKSMGMMAAKEYTFYVHTEANKAMIKEAVERMFPGTKVERVNTLNIQGKKKRRGTSVGLSAKKKKAMVKLTPESKEIEIFSGL
ncbi:MAG: 50S ribosomal protein L23 [Lachnospiraceae bacterium]|jgi:large subunit ribosomal protein L23|nr:50S ribosomal protein L23 [Lachnospiraceae bacterium]